MQFPDHPFWDFSLAAYSGDGVADACIALQEAHGADVNILLFCAWAGCNGVRFDRTRIEAVRDAVAAWHEEVVRPLRAVRRRLKTDVDSRAPDDPQSADLQSALRARVQRIEIDAEHIEQLRLAALAESFGLGQSGAAMPDSAAVDEAAARNNMEHYLSVLGSGADTETDDLLDTLAAAACRSLAAR